ncbi:MAG: hypothetical protein ACFB2W_23325 [Leptolyngbyaceae cyanobacterium]
MQERTSDSQILAAAQLYLGEYKVTTEQQMNLGKQIGLGAVVFFLNGCTPPVVEVPDSIDNEDSVIEIEFIESAPKDRFVVTNMGSCTLEELMLELDLSQSAGKLIFDTTATGAGVEVFQPFEVEEGDIVPLAAEGVNDGDTILALQIASLGPNNRASFTIDVDDTLPRSDLGQIRVADSEISGAVVTISIGNGETTSAKFDGSIAQADLPVCQPNDQSST